MEGKNSPNKNHRAKNKPAAICKRKIKSFSNFYLFNEKKTIVRATPSTLNYVLECYNHKPYRSFGKTKCNVVLKTLLDKLHF